MNTLICNCCGKQINKDVANLRYIQIKEVIKIIPLGYKPFEGDICMECYNKIEDFIKNVLQLEPENCLENN